MSSANHVNPNRRRLFKALLAGAVAAAALAKATTPSKAAGCYGSGKKNKVARKHHRD